MHFNPSSVCVAVHSLIFLFICSRVHIRVLVVLSDLVFSSHLSSSSGYSRCNGFPGPGSFKPLPAPSGLHSLFFNYNSLFSGCGVCRELTSRKPAPPLWCYGTFSAVHSSRSSFHFPSLSLALKKKQENTLTKLSAGWQNPASCFGVVNTFLPQTTN